MVISLNGIKVCCPQGQVSLRYNTIMKLNIFYLELRFRDFLNNIFCQIPVQLEQTNLVLSSIIAAINFILYNIGMCY